MQKPTCFSCPGRVQWAAMLLLLAQCGVAFNAAAECRIGTTLYDVGGRPGSGVTPINRSNPISVNDLKGWAAGDDVSTCDVSHLTHLDDAFAFKTDFNDDIGSWDVSNVVNTGFLFRFTNFNRDISGWDTSAMTNMSGMFNYAFQFNQDISTKVMNAGTADEYIAWDVSRNQSMIYMFWGATAFNQDIGNWNTSNVTTLEYAFTDAEAFNQDLSTKTVTVGSGTYTAWDVGQVTTTYLAFARAKAFNQDIGNWDVSRVTRFQSMFAEMDFNQDISRWDTSSATNLQDMFNGNGAFNQAIDTRPVTVNGSTYTAWDVSQVTTFLDMFKGASAFNQDISGWDVTSATTLQGMFINAVAMDKDIRAWTVAPGVTLDSMFAGATGMIEKFTGVTGFGITPTVAFFNGNSESVDDDGDGVPNNRDQCPDTPAGASVDANGCADSQKDSDGDGLTDDVDPFPFAVTQSSAANLSVTTTPFNATSSCSLQPISVSAVANPLPGSAPDEQVPKVVIELTGCDSANPESLLVEVDFGVAHAAGAQAFSIQADGEWLPIQGAIIQGPIASFVLTDNAPGMDQNMLSGAIQHQVTVAGAIPPLPVPNRSLWAMALLLLMLGLIGLTRLSAQGVYRRGDAA